MSLGIVVYDKRDNILNEDGIPFAILSDDNITVIKEKIFSLSSEDDYIKYYPNFVKIVDKNGKSIESCGTNVSKANKIYISSILENFDEENIFDLYFNLNGDAFNDLYDSLKKEFDELTDEDLIFVIKYIISKDDNVINQIRLIEPNIDNFIAEYIETITRKRDEIKKYYVDVQESLKEFYSLLYKTKEYEEISSIKYTGVVLSFGDQNRRKYIKLSQIFNTFELSKEIPFIALANKEGDPIVKIYNEILNTLSEKEMKSWILNEKKKLNQTSYKKIKGLMIKYKMDNTFLTFNLMENGYINVKINFTEEEVKTLDEIIYVMKVGINYIVNYINSLSGIFSKSEKLQIDDYKIETVTAVVETTQLLDLDVLKTTLFKTGYNDIFVLKDTKSQDMISMYYKKMCKVLPDDTETRGITVTVRNNPYKLNSSLINIYSALNVGSIERIAKMLTLMVKMKPKKKLKMGIMAKMDLESKKDVSEQKITSKANIKLIREQTGVSLSSKKCQKQRQPKVLDEVGVSTDKLAKPDSYILEFRNNKYICPTIEYPYPGFIGDNLPCCFNKPQRHTEKYIRNMHPELNDILVRPSNFKVMIYKNREQRFETYVIKVVSEYMPLMNETNSLPRYYYISEDKQLVPIKNDELVQTLDNEVRSGKEIWLNEVSLATLIFEPPKNKCNNTPNMERKDDMNLNAPCEHHEKNKIFGYNQNSFPCCFANPVDPYIKRTRKTDEESKVKDYILQQDKILNPDKIGILPPNIDNIFNNIIQKGPNKYYKRGVLTGQSPHSSFINAVLYGSNYKIKNASDFIRHIVEYLEKDNSVFPKLNSGDIIKKYGSLDNFIKNIRNSSWQDLLDITQRIVKCNVIIINIPYVPNKVELDYNNTQLHCSYNVNMDNRYPYVILIKKKNIFENVIEMDNKKNIIGYNFMYDDAFDNKSNIVNFLVDFYESTCIKEDIFPENFQYMKLYTNDELHKYVKGTVVDIKLQLLNKFNKVNMVVMNNGVILPIKQNGIKEYAPFTSLEEYLLNNLLTLDDYIRGINLINKFISTPIEILGVTVDENDRYSSVQTNFGILVPLKPTKRDDALFKYPILNFKYYGDADNKYSMDIIDKDIEYKLGKVVFDDDKVIRYIRQRLINKDLTRDEKVDEIVKLFKKIANHFYVNEIGLFSDIKLQNIAEKYVTNIGVVYANTMRNKKQEIYNIKQKLAFVISRDDELVKEIKTINRMTNINKAEKIFRLVKIFKEILSKDNKVKHIVNDFILKHIANETINDNVENTLLNNMVVPDEFDPNEIIQKESESVLLNIEDIKNWIKKYKQIDQEDDFIDVENENE
jgi:hypothetical protein